MERELTADEFRRFHDVIYQLTGIHYPAEKVQLLSNRLRKRMGAVGIADYQGYLAHIQNHRNDDEIRRFVDSVTTNETYFFRCTRHWEMFGEWARAHAETPAARKSGIRIWSAACSTGAEAYTALIVLEELLGRGFRGLTVEVVGTDLNQKVVAEAQKATYRAHALSQTQPDIAKRYFQRTDDDDYVLDRRLVRYASFRRHNLMEPMSGGPFDFVFLRNVMIYFDRQSKERVLGHARNAMRPGARLLIGESESLINIDHGLVYLKPSLFERAAGSEQPKAPTRPSPARR